MNELPSHIHSAHRSYHEIHGRKIRQAKQNLPIKRIAKPHSLRAQTLSRNPGEKDQTGKTKSTNKLSRSSTLRRNTEGSMSQSQGTKSKARSSSKTHQALPLSSLKPSSSQRDPRSHPHCSVSRNQQDERIAKPHSLRAQVLSRNPREKDQTGKTKSTNQLSRSSTLRRHTECSTSQSQGTKSKARSSSKTHQSLPLTSLKRSSSQLDPQPQPRCQVSINLQEQRITKPHSLRAQVPTRKAKSTQQLPTSSTMRPNTETAMNSSALDNCRPETSRISTSRKQTIERTSRLFESIKSTSVQTGLATDKSTESDYHKSNAKPSSPTKKRNKSSTVSSSESIQMSSTSNQCQLSHSGGGSLINSDSSTKPVSVLSLLNIPEPPRVSAKPKPVRQFVSNSNRSRPQISRRQLQVSCHDLVQVDPIPMTLESNSNIDNATNDLSHKSSKVSSRPEISPNTSTARSRKRKAPVQMSESSKRSRVGTLEKRRRLKGRKRKATPVKAPGKRKRLKKLSEHRSKRHVSDMVDLVSSSSEDEDTTCSSDADASTLVSTWRSSNNKQRSRRRLESNFIEPENSDTLTETDSSDCDGAGEVYEVESIRSEWIWIDHGEGGSENPIDTGSFLEVKWVGYDDSENTLQDRQSLKSSPDVLRFWDENQKQGSISV
eukprot:191056_1